MREPGGAVAHAPRISGGPPETLVPYRVAQPCPRVRLLCFPHGGGSASVFRDWQSLIGEEVEVWAVQPPGREGRRHERPYRRLADAVAELVGSLGPYLDRPFALFGHSVGADLAYALALELGRRNLRPPEHVIVAAQVPPHDRVIDDPLHLLDDAELLARLEGYGGIPAELLAEREALELALPRLRADLEMSETFAVTPADRLDVPVTAFGGLHDRTLHGPDIERWGELTSDKFQVEWWQGDHFFVHADAEEVVAQLHALLMAHAPPALARPAQSAAVRPVAATTQSVVRSALASLPTPHGEAQAGRHSHVQAEQPGPAHAEQHSPAHAEQPGHVQEGRPDGAGEEPGSATARDVAAAVAEVAPALAIEPDEHFFDAGLGSLALLRLQAALQARGYRLEITDLFRWPTMRRLAAGLDEQRAGPNR